MNACPSCTTKALRLGPYCTLCGTHVGPDVLSVRRRWCTWTLAALWAIVIIIVMLDWPVSTGDFPVATSPLPAGPPHFLDLRHHLERQSDRLGHRAVVAHP